MKSPYLNYSMIVPVRYEIERQYRENTRRRDESISEMVVGAIALGILFTGILLLLFV